MITQDFFNRLSQNILSDLKPGESLSLSLSTEETDYIRLNQARVRQNTHLELNNLRLRLLMDEKFVEINCQLSALLETDLKRVSHALKTCRHILKSLPRTSDFSALSNHGQSSQNVLKTSSTNSLQIASEVLEIAKDFDMAGILTCGKMIRASQNSEGQNHWFATDVGTVDYSLYTKNQDAENKALKRFLGFRDWSTTDFKNQIDQSKPILAALKKPNRTLAPGAYRTFLDAGANSELTGLLGWGAVSVDSFKRGESPFQKFHQKEVSLSKKVSVTEDFTLGLHPRFNSLGEVAPEQICLIKEGQAENFLVSSRSQKLYGLNSHNAAETGNWFLEGPRSVSVAPGLLQEADILKRLGTGLWIGNLHYLNWSDRSNARITGMTRYACFWVENGEIVQPIHDMRFDDSLYSLWGEALEDFTAQTSLETTTDTYSERSLGGKKVPGALLKEMKFTL